MIPMELMAAKVHEAVAVRRNPDFLLIARTNAMRASTMDDALRREKRIERRAPTWPMASAQLLSRQPIGRCWKRTCSA